MATVARGALLPFKPRHTTRFKVEGGGDAVLLGPLQVVQSTYKRQFSEHRNKAPVGPAGERSWVICPCREPHTRNRDSSFHPAPILVQLPGPLACCHAFLVFGPCLGSSPETAARHPVGVPGAVRNAGWTARDGQAAADRQPVRACSVMRKIVKNGLEAARQAQAKSLPVAGLPVSRPSRFRVRGPPWGHAQNCVVPDARYGTYFFTSCLND